MTRLTGITWAHPRGYAPLVAASAAYRALHPEIEIVWAKRSLLEFGEAPVEQLAGQFDLLVIDHPYVGFGAEAGVFLPLDAWLSAEFLHDHRADSVGRSAESYWWAGRPWALAIDAACPVAHWRPDLLAVAAVEIPRTWDEVLALIRQKRVLAPLIHTDAIHVFYMFCHALGAEPFAHEAQIVPRAAGVAALEAGRELASALPAQCLKMNPIAVLDELARHDTWWYCPFAFGYSNYARAGYAPQVVASGPLPLGPADRPLRTTLGGTGLAVSSSCRQPAAAAEFAAFVASEEFQRGHYFAAGGQPARRSACVDRAVNAASGGFFFGTLAALDQAWLRPRYAGYLHFQDHGAHVVAECFAGDLAPTAAFARLEALHHESRARSVSTRL